MSRQPLLGELPVELDLRLELDDDLTVFLPASSFLLCGLRPGESLVVDIHPLSLRLDSVEATGGRQTPESLPLAHIDLDGRIRLPFEPPLLRGRRMILLQLRQRGAHREIHLLADPQ
jgi:hypothetical protein